MKKLLEIKVRFCFNSYETSIMIEFQRGTRLGPVRLEIKVRFCFNSYETSIMIGTCKVVALCGHFHLKMEKQICLALKG